MSSERAALAVALAIALTGPAARAEDKAKKPRHGGFILGLEVGAIRLPGYRGTYGPTGFGKALILGFGLGRLSFEWYVGQSYAMGRPAQLEGKGLDGQVHISSYGIRYHRSGIFVSGGLAVTSVPVVLASTLQDDRVAGIGGVVGIGTGLWLRGGYFSLELRAARAITELPAGDYLVRDGGGIRIGSADVDPWLLSFSLGVRSYRY